MKWRRAKKKPILVEFREAKPKAELAIYTKSGIKWVMGERILTKEGILVAIAGQDFIIRGIKGELYPIHKNIFYETYEVLGNDRTETKEKNRKLQRETSERKERV